MDGFPDAEVEGDLHPRLLLVVGLRNTDLDRNALRMGVHGADIGDAVGAPKEADEIVGEAGITQSDEHLSPTFCHDRSIYKSGPSGCAASLQPWRS